MDNQDGLGETLCDFSHARIAPYKNTWKRFQNTVVWCNLKLLQQRGQQFYQTRSNAVILFDTLPAEFIEKAIWVKTKDQLFSKGEREFWDCVLFLKLIRKVIHKIYLHKKQDHLGNRNKMQTATGKPEATPVKLQDARRQHNVTILIKMFEKHQDKEQFLKDMSQKQEITTNALRHEPQRDSAKHQCPDCNSSTEFGII